MGADRGLPAALRYRTTELLARGQVSGRKDAIATLWDISLERINAENPAAQLLYLCAYLAPKRIPPDLIYLASRAVA